MQARAVSIAITATLALIAIGAPRTLAAGEFTLQGAYVTGSYGTETETNARALLLRYVTGDRVQFRVEAPFLDLDAASPVTPGPIGPIPRRRRGQEGEGTGGQGSGSQGSGAQGDGDDEPLAEPLPSDLGRVRGLGDVALGVSARVLGGGARIYLLRADAGVKLPTGDAEENLGTGETDFRLGTSGEYRFWSTTGFGGVGWTLYGDPEDRTLKDGLDGWAGVESHPLRDRFIVSGWLSGNQEVVAGTGARATASVGFRTVGRWRWRASLTGGLTDAAEDFQVQVGVSFGVDVPTAGRRGSWR